ncbi:hypothetical protein [Kurthia huakuii]|uniref:hypothetical protein n=1 Tax=Kurthia huakuii TaxID=1421019 RepID=UPI0004960924|nr:hypothetical protein [Kurthia huakuii]MBM7698669.1 hypothetical protein [Kurthia huakuii]
MSYTHENFQQIDIFAVLKEIQDIEWIEKNILNLMPGKKITTTTCEVELADKFIVVRSCDFEEIFTSKEVALKYIKDYFEGNKKSVSSN